MIVTLAALAAMAVAGAPLAAGLAAGAGRGGRLGYAFLLGASGVAVALLALSVTGVAWSRVTLIGALGALALGSEVARRASARRTPVATAAAVAPRGLAALLDAGTALTVVAHARYATHAEIVEWDYVAMWGQKAKTFFLAGGVDLAYLSDPDRVVANRDYPPLVPLLLDAIAVARGAWSDREVGLVFTAFGAALLLVARDALGREGLDPVRRSLATLALSGASLSPWVGLAEGAMLAYLGAGWLAVRRGLRESAPRWLALGGVLLGAAALTKNEGSLALAAAVAGVAVASAPAWRSGLSAAARVALPGLALAAPWIAVRWTCGLVPFLAQGRPFERFVAHWSDPLPWLAALVRYPPDHVFYWLVAGGVVATAVRRAWREERFLLVALALAGAAYVLQNAFIPVSIVGHIKYSFHRLAAQLALPLGYLAIALTRRRGEGGGPRRVAAA